MFSALLRALQRLLCRVQAFVSPELCELRQQYACGRIKRDEYERVKRDLCD